MDRETGGFERRPLANHKKREIIVNDVVLTDPDDLEPHERTKLRRLLTMNQKDFDEAVRQYATDAEPLESDQLIFRHPEIVEMVVDALTRLIGASQRAHQTERSRNVRNLLNDEIRMLGRARKSIGPYVHAAVADTARGSLRDRAEKVLGRVCVPELRAIMKDLERGMSVKDAEAAARARRAERQKAAAPPRTTG